jgi:hypothetical protein
MKGKTLGEADRVSLFKGADVPFSVFSMPQARARQHSSSHVWRITFCRNSFRVIKMPWDGWFRDEAPKFAE